MNASTISAPAEPGADRVGGTAETGFLWPDPPLGSYPPAAPSVGSAACEIVGLNGQRIAAHLLGFHPDGESIDVQVTAMRRTTTLRFSQFRMLVLSAPAPAPAQAQAPDRFDIAWADGSASSGQTLGQRAFGFGCFLFLPAEKRTAYKRVFLPPVSAKQMSFSPASVQPVPAAQLVEEPDPMPTEQVTTPEQLLDQLARQARMPMVRIGEALLSLGMITDEQLRAGLAQQQLDRNVPLGETLVRMGAVTKADLQAALARKMGYPVVNLQLFPAAAEALRKISHGVARRLQVMPLMMHEGRLILALDDPASRHSAMDEVEFIAQAKVVAVLGRCNDLNAVLLKAYEKIGGVTDARSAATDLLRPIEFDLAGTNELLETLEKEGQPSADDDAPIEQSDNSLVRMINRMILEAHAEGVSDIHIESYPGREKIRIRFRRDGRLHTYLELPPNYRSALIARVKIMCDLDISEKRKPQDGKINFSKFSPQHRIELRVATIPTNNGLEDVVMRILASAQPIALDALGLSAFNLQQFTKAIERPYGMVLCVGPTGSGKTTTLHSALMHINTPERKIWTAEDPIEITQPGLRQVQVNARIDWTFAKALRAFVRADPDVIMVGEIRDEETAKIAVEASLTGHLVLSTLHTNSAPETVTRLLDMGMDPFNFADSLLAVLAQRLVRRLCSHCVTSRPATSDELDELLSDFARCRRAGQRDRARDAAKRLAAAVRQGRAPA
ncbi:MAG: ATPase, T2SS/T4P/T4SS family [Variovorax sp.]